MKIMLAAAALAALTASAMPAAALQENGMTLYQQCGNGFTAGFVNHDFCHGYVMGFADALNETHQICLRGASDVQIVMVVQNWLRAHPQHLGNRAEFMVRNALESAWSCH